MKISMNYIKFIYAVSCLISCCTQAFAALNNSNNTDQAESHSSMGQPDCKSIEKPAQLANLLYSDIGIDHSMLTLSMGYGRYFELKALQRRLLLFADYGMPLTNPDLRNFRLRVGVGSSAFDYKTFQIPVRLSFNVVGAHNKIFQAVGLGSELGIAPGYYGSMFEVASEFYWDQQWTTHITHSDLYRKNFYENAKNGWYVMSAASIRAGLHLGWNINEHFLLGIKGGYQRHGQYNVLVPPVYCTLHTEFRL